MRLVLVSFLFCMLSLPSHGEDIMDRPAREVFGHLSGPTDGRAEVFGAYAKGCIAGARQLASDGPYWQAMRPSRNRAWGHPELVAFIERFSEDAAQHAGWPGLLVGDMAQPRGGPMLTGHASHQSGLDVDIWLTPMPDRRLSAREREEMSAVMIVENGPHEVDSRVWTQAHFNLIKRAANDPQVDRVLVAAGIKRALCAMEKGNREWLRTVRPFWGHNFHMHVRLKCPADSPLCQPQAAKAPGDGCGADLDWWFTDEPWKPKRPAPGQEPRKPFPITLSALPPQCKAVALDQGQAGASALPSAPLPGQKPF